MIRIGDIASTIEAFAPLAAQESYDNCGLLVGDSDAEVDGALLCVDITEQVIDEAEHEGIKLVISHHPVIFLPLKNITGAGYEQRVVARALKSGIALYAAHTNLDAAPDGMSHFLAKKLGLGKIKLLSSTLDERTGFGVIGHLSTPATTYDFLRHTAKTLNIGAIRHSALPEKPISRVALCTGAGEEFIPAARKAGAELFMCADIRFHNFLQASGSMPIADIGHYESEYCAVELLMSIISKNFPTFALRNSVHGTNPVHYLVTI